MTRATTFVDQAHDYLALRRRLGFALVSQGRSLLAFAGYADRVRPGAPLTVDLAVEWATATRSTDPSCASRRLSVVRGFARHRALFDPATQVPPTGLVGTRYRRKQPHVYSPEEIAALLEQAAALRPHGGLRPRTFVTLLGLMLCTGLRVSEARNLTCRDVDLGAGVITVREGKFRKSRLVPLHPSAVEALSHYAAERDTHPGTPPSEHFFRTERLASLSRMAVQATFAKMRQRLRWSAEGRARMPRLQDTRHTFVVTRLVRWHVEGVEVDQRIAALATYLGHAKVTDTYWYLSAVPELMAVVGERFEHFARQRRGDPS
jgi:integrase/recombinase XerD